MECGFLWELLSGRQLFGLNSYMFDETIPFPVRILSLFHIWLPVLLLWQVRRLSYDSRAWYMQTAVTCAIFVLTYLLTDPAQNINWVFGPGNKPQSVIPPVLYLICLIAFVSLAIYLPLHFVFLRLFSGR